MIGRDGPVLEHLACAGAQAPLGLIPLRHLIPQRKGRLAMAVTVLIVAALVIVIGLGYVIVFRLMKGTQTVVPEVSDERAARADRVVAMDDRGQPVSEAEEGSPEPPRDEAGFEKVLGESLDELHPGREE